MSKLDLGPIGITVPVSADGGHLGDAAALEKLGYSALWLRGGQIDSLDRIAEVVRATSAVPVVPAIIPLNVYPSGDVIRLYADLEEHAPGRFVAGLGGPQAARPLRPLNEYLDRLDQGDPPVPASRRILAALGPRKLEIARDRAAGAVLLLVTPAYTRTSRGVLGPYSTLVVNQMAVLEADAGRARDIARGPLRFLSQVPGYRASFARMGFTSADVDGLSDEIVDRLVAWGDGDAIASRVSEHLRAGADHVAVTMLEDGRSTPSDAARELARNTRMTSKS